MMNRFQKPVTWAAALDEVLAAAAAAGLAAVALALALAPVVVVGSVLVVGPQE